MNQIPPRRPQRLVAAAIVPQNVLRALIGQSKKRCAAYAEMLAKLAAGMEQLRYEAERLAQENLPEPEVVAQAREHYEAVQNAFAQNRMHLEAQAHYELRLQEVLSRWLVVAAGPRTAPPGMQRAPRAPRPAPGPAPAPRPAGPRPGFAPYVVRPPEPRPEPPRYEPRYEPAPAPEPSPEPEAEAEAAPPPSPMPSPWAYGSQKVAADRPNGPARPAAPAEVPPEDEHGEPA
jgi:hypothetical protein